MRRKIAKNTEQGALENGLTIETKLWCGLKLQTILSMLPECLLHLDPSCDTNVEGLCTK